MVEAPPESPSLDSVRRELEDIDRAIVLLIAARVEAAGVAIRIRSEGGQRISDPAQESRVLARARQWAEEAGLSPGWTESIFRAMIETGKDRFRDRVTTASSRGVDPENSAVQKVDRVPLTTSTGPVRRSSVPTPT